MTTNDTEQLEQEARILADQADRFVSRFSLDLSRAETFSGRSEGFRVAADAFERIALAEKTVNASEWFQATNVDGRSVNEIMDRLWRVREALARIQE
jgi:hypothetical protein